MTNAVDRWTEKLLRMPRVYGTLQRVTAGGFLTAILRRELRSYASSRVLELACGLGGNAGLFASSGYDGIDIEERYIAAARAADPTRRIHRMDARKLEFADGSFELVFAVGLFHHLSDDDARQVLLEIRRVTVAGGRVFVLDAIWPLRRWNVAGWLLRRLDRGKFVRTAREYAGLFGEVFAPVEVSVRSRFPLDFVVLDLRT